MWRHKSLGLLTGIIVAPRVAYRVFNWAKVRRLSQASCEWFFTWILMLKNLNIFDFICDNFSSKKYLVWEVQSNKLWLKYRMWVCMLSWPSCRQLELQWGITGARVYHSFGQISQVPTINTRAVKSPSKASKYTSSLAYTANIWYRSTLLVHSNTLFLAKEFFIVSIPSLEGPNSSSIRV